MSRPKKSSLQYRVTLKAGKRDDSPDNSNNGSDDDGDDNDLNDSNTTSTTRSTKVLLTNNHPSKQLKSSTTRYHSKNPNPNLNPNPNEYFGFPLLSFIPGTTIILKSLLGITISLYILNQQRLLPKQVSRVVSKYLFWPTLPITYIRRLGTSWITTIDDTVIMGGAPFGFVNLPEKLYDSYGVRGVINMCEEYRGPLRKYKTLGIESIHLPTVDHFEPSIEDMEEAILFIEKFRKGNVGNDGNLNNSKVYVHCRAGHGRSASIVLAWLLSKEPNVNLKELNEELVKLRNVRKSLWQQPNLIRLQNRLKMEYQNKKKTGYKNENDK